MLRKLFLTIGIVAALALAGCGGDDDSTSTDAAAETSAPAEAPESTEAAPEPTEEEANGSDKPESIDSKPTVEVPSGPPPKQLETEDLIVGDGPEVKSGDEISVQYVGVTYKDGKQFDASWDRGEAFPLTIGVGGVIAGWDQGVPGMKVGGRRKLTIPPELGYGQEGFPPGIPPNETLVFVVDIVSVK